MKSTAHFIILLAIILLFSQCKTAHIENGSEMSIVVNSEENGRQMTIQLLKGKEYNNPTFVFWKEDLQGNYLETIFITKAYASGIFGHEMQGDTLWKETPGPSYQPAALPYWTYHKGYINGFDLIPTPEHPFVDAYTGATPTENFSISTKLKSEQMNFRLYLEVNQSWDWNSYWTNHKYPESHAYKHSAQPSIVYSVEINEEMNTFYMNPIGHGDPQGESGRLFTDLSTLSTAMDIFHSIQIKVNN